MLSSITDYTTEPLRIVSLVPSQTELLFYLGLDEQVVGITKFCIHPASGVKTKPTIGGTKNINLEKIKELNPTLIIANKEENVKEQVEELAKDYLVWLTDVNNLPDALKMITNIGMLTGKADEAGRLSDNIISQFASIVPAKKKISCCYLVWRHPYMTVGGDTFINDMLQHCGLQNKYAAKARYPEINIDELSADGCDLLLLSSEPYPFKQSHMDQLRALLPATKIILVDGEPFSWYGSRLLQAPGYFNLLLSSINSAAG